MFRKKKLSHICPFKLTETYDTLYEIQQKLGLSDDYLMSTVRNTEQDSKHSDNLKTLLEASKETRDNLITWNLRQPQVELNVTLSLLTAKIKFIQYKLALCDGIDLHQACSLSLVDFCNILSDMTVLNVKPTERKTMHKVSHEVGIPVWLSHYRNQICHVPSESPCISILVPLIIKSLNYMRDAFWSGLLERETFDAQACKKLIVSISNFTQITSINQRMELRRDLELGKKKLRLAQTDLIKSSKACKSLRRLLMYNPNQVIEILVSYVIQFKPKDSSKNCALLLEQVILARCLERFVYKLLAHAEEQTQDKFILLWLQRVISLISLRKKDDIKRALHKMDLNISVKMIRLTEISPVKCCQIAYRLIKLDHQIVKNLIIKMRHRLLPILGKKRTLLLIELTKVATSLPTSSAISN